MPTFLRAAAALLSASLPISARDPTPPQQPPIPLASPRDRVFLDEPGDGLVWARGGDWKASFGAAGCTFVPFLGSNAPRNFPVSLRLVSAKGGEASVPLDLQRPARAVATSRITIDRGAVTEIYELDPRGIEQKFVFTNRTGNGDYSVTMHVTTELGATVHADGSLTFANELGGVRVGTATAVDARGATAPVTTSLANGVLVYTVPVDFAARAAFPLTIDPLISTLPLVFPSAPNPLLNSDVAYVASFGGVHAAVVEDIWSAADHDVRLRGFNHQGNLLDAGYIDISTENWVHPRIASNHAASQFLCVAKSDNLSGRLVDLAAPAGNPTFVYGAQFYILLPPPPPFVSSTFDPDVGGDPSSTASLPGHYCVACKQGLGVLWWIVRTDGQFGAAQFATNPFGVTASKPTVSKCCGSDATAAKQWMLTWEQEATANNQDIYGMLIHVDGTVAAPGFLIDGSTFSDTRPEVSSQTDPINGVSYWMVVHQRLIPGSPPFSQSHSDIVGAIFSGTTSITGPVNLTTLLNRPLSREQWNPCVDTDGGRFAVGFSEKVSQLSLDVAPWLATVHLAGTSTIGVTSYPEVLNLYVESDDNMRISAEHSGGGISSRYMATWSTSGIAGQGALAAFYKGHSDIPPASYFNHALAGCGQMSIVASGLPALGETMYLDLLNAQGVPLFLIGQSVAPVTLCGGCDLGIDASSMSLLAQSNITYTVPQDMSLIGAQVAVQGLDVFAPGGCPASLLGFEFTLTDEIIITFL